MNTPMKHIPLNPDKSTSKWQRVLVIAVVVVLAVKICPELFGWLVLFSICYFIYWTFEAADRKGRMMDCPPPVIYGLHAEAVWAQVEEALRTVPSFLPNVSVHIDNSTPLPPPNHPLFVQANFKIYHPELLGQRDMLSNEDKSLTSHLIMQAWIEPVEAGSKLTLIWTSMPIQSRLAHDQIITTMTRTIHALVRGIINEM